MTEINHFAMQLPLDVDLSEFSLALANLGIEHRITQENVYQVIWVAPSVDPSRVVERFHQWQAGAIGEQSPGPARQSFRTRALINLRAFPLTVTLIVINVLLVPVGLGAASGSFTGFCSK